VFKQQIGPLTNTISIKQQKWEGLFRWMKLIIGEEARVYPLIRKIRKYRRGRGRK
jgi:hypothetical protein